MQHPDLSTLLATAPVLFGTHAAGTARRKRMRLLFSMLRWSGANSNKMVPMDVIVRFPRLYRVCSSTPEVVMAGGSGGRVAVVAVAAATAAALLQSGRQAAGCIS